MHGQLQNIVLATNIYNVSTSILVHYSEVITFCFRAGLTFASVHDCYWTHANDVDLMNKVRVEQSCRTRVLSLSLCFSRKQKKKIDNTVKRLIFCNLICSTNIVATFATE